MRIDNIQQVLDVQPTLVKTLEGFVDTERVEAAIVGRCERAFADVHGVSGSHSVVGVSNGTDAIILALEALGIGAGDAVIVPGLTWQATAGAVLDVNAVPVILDIDRSSRTLDPDVVEEYLESRARKGQVLPKAIIVVHLFNRAANMDRFTEIARRYGLFLIEDCAHSHGASWRGRPLGTFGVAGTFSTQRTKPLAGVKKPGDSRWECPTGSEGGFVLTAVPVIDTRLRSLASCGRPVGESAIDTSVGDELDDHWRAKVAELGLAPDRIQSGNNRLPASIAERLLDQLDRFPAEHRQRAATLAELDPRLRRVPGIVVLDAQPEMTTPVAHMLAFGFDRDVFGGIDSELFRQVLSHLIGGYLVDKPYDALGGGEDGYQSPVYNPHTKPRYRVSEDHWAAIDPSQWHLPVSHETVAHFVAIEHTALRETHFADALIAALTWMGEHSAEIAAAAR